MSVAASLTDDAYGAVLRFGRRRTESHVRLALHAAVPLGLSPELVHLLRVNFIPEAPFIAEADLLLSPLCSAVGGRLYEMDPEIREVLLQELLDDPLLGLPRLQSVASFIVSYAE